MQDALSRNSSIPVPEVITLDEEIYDKMYPATFTVPKSRVRSMPYDDEETAYDMDLEDEKWISNIPAYWKLTPDKFELVMHWLEESTVNHVPKLSELQAQPFSRRFKLGVLDVIYDYWLEKRLRGKQKLIFQLKKIPKHPNKHRLRLQEDPYVAFTQREAKMHTRKNRAQDEMNYMKMLQIRQSLTNELLRSLEVLQNEKRKNRFVRMKFDNFKNQYLSGNFKDPVVHLEGDVDEYQESVEKMIDDEMENLNSSQGEDSGYMIELQDGCKYNAVS